MEEKKFRQVISGLKETNQIPELKAEVLPYCDGVSLVESLSISLANSMNRYIIYQGISSLFPKVATEYGFSELKKLDLNKGKKKSNRGKMAQGSTSNLRYRKDHEKFVDQHLRGLLRFESKYEEYNASFDKAKKALPNSTLSIYLADVAKDLQENEQMEKVKRHLEMIKAMMNLETAIEDKKRVLEMIEMNDFFFESKKYNE